MMRDPNKINPPTEAEKFEAHKLALSAKVMRLGAQAGDVILVKPAGEAHRTWSNDAAKALSEHFGAQFGDTGLLLVIPPGADLESANPEMMAKHGWVRADSHDDAESDSKGENDG